MRRLGVLLATGAGAGYSPIAPGTAGSAVGVLIYLLLRHTSVLWESVVLAFFVVAGIWAGGVAARHFQRDDPGQVVVDEIAGQLLTLLATGASGWGIVLAFIVFRALDTTKPWPARALERLHGGLGIMADDLMVGVYGNLIVHAVQMARPGVF